MKKYISILLSIILTISVAFSTEINAFAQTGIEIKNAEGNVVETITIEGNDIGDELKSAFKYCDENAKADNVLNIDIPSGSYYVRITTFPSDNTVINMKKDTVLINDCPERGNIFCSRKNCTGYNGISNLTINGGTLTYSQQNKNQSVLIRLGHANDILICGTTFLNGYVSHFVEIAGSKNVTLDGCTFEGYSNGNTNNSGEAVQIDILEEKEHFPYIPEYDGTMNDSITVENCKFNNLLSGVGTKNIFYGYYQSNIVIKNNTFTNLSGVAINAYAFINSQIMDNLISNCGVGIDYYMMKKDNKLSTVCAIDNNGVINDNCNTQIENNVINVVPTKEFATPIGIECFGNYVDGAKSATIAQGNYAVNGVVVKENAITTFAKGIECSDMYNSIIEDNTVVGRNKQSRGIALINGCYGNKICENVVSKFYNNMYVHNSYVNEISDNNFTNSGSSSIAINGNSSGINIKDNNVSKSATHGLYVASTAKLGTVKSNYFSNCTKYGMYFANGAIANIDTSNSYKKVKALVGISNGSKVYTYNNLSTPTFTAKKKSKGKGIDVKINYGTYTFTIYRKAYNEKTFKKKKTTTSKKYSDTAVKKGKKYTYKIIATKKIKNVSISSNYSKDITVKA